MSTDQLFEFIDTLFQVLKRYVDAVWQGADGRFQVRADVNQKVRSSFHFNRLDDIPEFRRSHAIFALQYSQSFILYKNQ